MKCIFCGCADLKVVDSRSADELSIRRRRECTACGRRFTTYESIEFSPVLVIKRDGSRQQFEPAKIRKGVLTACEKRPVSAEAIEQLVEEIAKDITNRMLSEISSKEIGEMVMVRLKDIDEVAYVRYASVYRSFTDISTFMVELQKLMEQK
ncbi:MAG: transcriptional regulator NrdR [Christensenellaceae bacterium]